MGQQISRTVFDSLLAKTHVGHALVQPDDTHNGIPTALATLVFLDATPAQLEVIYELKRRGLRTWSMSPERITDRATMARFLGDDRFQRAYMDYFSMENGRLAGNSKALALSYLLSDSHPLIFGLFGGFGQPLIFLSDAIELQSAVLVVESLVLTAVTWNGPICELLNHTQLASLSQEYMSPEAIFTRVAYDARLGGLMKSGPGYHRVSQILSNEKAKAAVLEYVHRLDIRNLPRLVNQLARFSTLLVCATHKPERPAFDYYLSFLPTFVCSLRVLLDSFQDSPYKIVLIRGVWLLMLLSYVTQLRPIIDPALITSTRTPLEDMSWPSVLAEFHSAPETMQGKYRDTQLLRTLRSLQQLGHALGADESFFLQAAWKLRCEWQQWAGFGNDREESLNIRL